jgi:hypothetical protein
VTVRAQVRNQKVRPLLAIAAVVAVAVTVVVSTSGTTPSPAAVNGTLVTFARTGGFAGVNDRVTVKRDRRVTVRSRGDAAKHTRLSRAAMQKLRRELDDAQIDHPPADSPPSCADCFVYTITYKGHRVQLTEDGIPERMQPAIQRLSRLIRR